MKKIFFLLITGLLLTASNLFSQQTIDEEKVKKGMALMKKMMEHPADAMTVSAEIKALKLNSAEDKEMRTRSQKEMMLTVEKTKSQAMKMGGISQEQVQKRMEDKDRIVPVRDDARIKAVMKRTLTDAEIKNFCKTVHEAVQKQMNPKAVDQAEKIYVKMKTQYPSTAAMGNGAISCYLYNLTQQSIYIMGKVCSEDAGNANNLNNYAALLTNHGVEQGAIPLLNYLNRKYGKNDAILSNLAVAWMGLGDLKTAEKYADSCIRFFPDRSAQAHYVKSIVKESTGDRPGAVQELKQSIGQNYSAEKEHMLRKIGGNMNIGDHKKILPADALGLSRFTWPTLPMNYEAAINSSQEWLVFKKTLDMAIAELRAKEEQANKEIDKYTVAETKRMLAEVQEFRSGHGYAFAANNNTNQGWQNFYSLLLEETARKETAFSEEIRSIEELEKKAKQEMDEAVKKLDEQYENYCGEGQPCPESEICKAYLEKYNKYMGQVNKLYDDFYASYIPFKRKSINEIVYAAKYALNEVSYEQFKISWQLKFLYALKNIHYKTPNYFPAFGGSKSACINVNTNPFSNKGLSKFEDIHCDNKWEMNFVGGTSVSTDCNKITIKLDFQAFQVTKTDDLFTGEWTNMTLEFGKSIGTKEIGISGIVEAGAEAGAFIEIDRRGISDYGVKGKAGVGIKDLTNNGAEVKVSLKSGKASFGVKSELTNVQLF